MDSPYLESGESIVLTTDRVSVNSRQYDLLLTTKYLILIDIRYSRFLPEKIPLQSVLSVNAGKIASGDPVITLFFSGTDQTGGSDQMNLIFSRQPGEERGRERDEWLRKLMELVVASRQEPTSSRKAPVERETGIRPAKRRQIAPEMQLPHSTIIESRPEPIKLAILPDEPGPPAPSPDSMATAGDLPQILPKTPAFPECGAPESQVTLSPEISREEIPGSGSPAIDETREKPESPDASNMNVPKGSGEELAGSVTEPEGAAPDMPTDSGAQPVSPDNLPGQPEIIVPMISPGEPEGSAAIPDTSNAEEILPDSRTHPVSPDRVPGEPESSAPITSPEEPAIPGTTTHNTSAEKTPTDFPTQPVLPDRVPEEPESTAPVTSPGEPAEAVTIPDMPAPDGIIAASPAQEPSRIESQGSIEESAGQSSQDNKGEGQTQELTDQSGTEHAPEPGSTLQPGGDHNRQTTFMLAAAILVLILGIAAIAAFSPAWFGAPSGILPPVPTPSVPETLSPIPSPPVIPEPTPLIIPTTGVWVRVTYPQDFYGRLGNPGSLREVSGSGDRLYQMNADNHLVQVQMYKTDNSGDMLSVEIYRNGESMTRRTTTSPMGFIDLLVDSTTGAPPGIPPRITGSPGAVTAENQTAQASIRPTLPPAIRTTPSQSPTVVHTVNQTTGTTNQTNNRTGPRVLYF